MPDLCRKEEEIMAEKPPRVRRTEFRGCSGCGDLLAAGEVCPNCKK